MLTRSGSLVAVGGVGLVVAGRVFGLGELYVAGAAVGALVVLAVVWTLLTRLDLAAGRMVDPPRVHVGAPARATIRLRNLRRTRTPLLRLLDPVSGTGGADLLVNPLKTGEVATVAYRLPTARRGIVGIGPLDVVVEDPFGLCSIRTRATGRSELTVFPHVDPIDPPRLAAGPDPTTGAVHPSSLGRSGDEFYALRPYVVGDDLRRVHWPSTARSGDLVVRQDEVPWQGRATVLLDQRRGPYDADRFEAAVSAAASVVAAACRRGDLVRLLATDGTDTGFGNGHGHLEAVFELLAVVERVNRSDPVTTVATPGTASGGGTLVVVTGELLGSEHEALRRASRGFQHVSVVTFAGGTSVGATGRSVHIPVTRPDAFVPSWQRVHARRRAVLR